ncbi:hypothetical protein BDQ12DRAFT_668460 [Crucibulum laeve]|uniref:DUF6534 domain-containing protein n=1 Tax=Crucibulum laeve TaxID=68775 RepID=A0A5C3LRQ5_9AGAR|nr:hypothetical protein BDQ12DRAFT_668460 [Crucibulum laeve]
MASLFVEVCLVQLSPLRMPYRPTIGRDRWFIKALGKVFIVKWSPCLYVVVVGEIIQLVLMTHTIYTAMVLGYGTFQYLLQTPWSSPSAPAINGIISMLIQIFFAWRIWVLKNDKVGYIITGIIIAIAMLQCSSSIAVTVKYIQIGRVPSRFAELTMPSTLWLSGSLVCDTLISVVMVYLLKQSKKKAPFKASETMVNTLIVITIETGAITAVFALLEMIFFLKNPENFLHICFLYILGRLFSNVLLAVLNGRDRIRHSGQINRFTAHGNTPQDQDISFSTFYTSQNSQSKGTTLPLHEINVVTVTETRADDISGRGSSEGSHVLSEY